MYKIKSNTKTVLQLRPNKAKHEVLMLVSKEEREFSDADYAVYKEDIEAYKNSKRLVVEFEEGEVEEDQKPDVDAEKEAQLKELKSLKKTYQEDLKKIPKANKVEIAEYKKEIKALNKQIKELGE